MLLPEVIIMAASATAPLSTKVTPDEKGTFLQLCEEIGTSPSNALRMFVAAFNRRGGFPFDTANPNGFNADTLRAMQDAVAGDVSGPFKTNQEMWESIFADGGE